MLKVISRLADKLTYANVVATLALFVSLGGVSYAAVVLPAHSVGEEQLRAGAVSPAALSFPVGAVGVTDKQIEDLPRGPCNGGGSAVDNIAPMCGPAPPRCPPRNLSELTPGKEVHIRFRRPGGLLLSAVTNLKYEGASQTSARTRLLLHVDERCVGEYQVTISEGQSMQVPLQAFTSVRTGIHSANLDVEVMYPSEGSGHVVVSGTSLIASAAPRD